MGIATERSPLNVLPLGMTTTITSSLVVILMQPAGMLCARHPAQGRLAPLSTVDKIIFKGSTRVVEAATASAVNQPHGSEQLLSGRTFCHSTVERLGMVPRTSMFFFVRTTAVVVGPSRAQTLIDFVGFSMPVHSN